MKFDSEQVFCHSALGHKAQPFEYNDNALDSATKSGSLIIKENQKGFSCDLKLTERDAVHLPYAINDGDGWTAIEFDCSMGMDDLKDENKDEIRDFVASPTYSSRKTGSFDEDSDFVMDKGVKECELPELTVCYKESIYHAVKDICIDEGVPSQEKILFESGSDERTVCIDLPVEKDQNKESVKEKEVIKKSIPDGLQFSAENDSNKDSANQCDLKDLMQTREYTPDNSIANGVSEEMLLPGNKLPMLDIGTSTSHFQYSNNDSNKVEQQPFQVSAENTILASPDLVSAVEDSDNGSGDSMLANSILVHATEESNNHTGDPMLATPALVSSAEESKNSTGDEMLAGPAHISAAGESGNGCPVNELVYNSKVENGSITFDFNSLAPEASGREECLENGESECLETQKTSKLEEGISDVHTVSRQLQRGQGETSFSAVGHGEETFSGVGPLASLINYSGQIAYSGSVSLRSDSSTTSTRSFAFPILQSEWNSSPVKMAKADRRHFQKRRNWGQSLLCCRF